MVFAVIHWSPINVSVFLWCRLNGVIDVFLLEKLMKKLKIVVNKGTDCQLSNTDDFEV